MNKEQILKRMKEIADEIIVEGADVVKLESEANELRASLTALEKREKILKGINEGTLETRSIEKPGEEVKVELSKDELLKSPEYRSAWLKTLQGVKLNEAEQRAYDASNTGAAVPSPTADILFSKMTKLAPMLSEITLLRVAGNVNFTTEGVRNAAALHTENGTITGATDTLVKVSLAGYEYNKLLYVSKTVQTMSINAFEGWLVDMIAEDIAVAIEDAIINGSGSSQPKGVANAATWSTTSNLVEVTGTYVITYANILSLIGLLPQRYDSNAKFLANKAMVYQGLANVKDSNGRPILVNDATSEYPFKILGFPVIVSDKVAAKNLFFGDYKKIVGNLAQDVLVERDASAGFASNSIAYRGGAIFDCDIALADAFVKLTTATY